MKGIYFVLDRKSRFAAIHVCDKEENADATLDRPEIVQPIAGPGSYSGKFAIAGFVRCSEEM